MRGGGGGEIWEGVEGEGFGKGLVINYFEGGGGATKWENCGSVTFCG